MSRVASGCESTGPRDPYGAFCRENHVALAGRPTGPLAGRTFAAKDVFDIEGVRTGWGHPDWLRDQPPAGRTATVIRLLLEAGASLVGKTVTDELCYSLSGENIHYGAPRNPRDPDRSPGGSSSGSVVAVTAGLADFAIGTDCGGSVRLPASYCGVYGVRPTHGRVPTDGLHELASDFDCIGWFARDPELLLRVGRVLLRDGGRPRQFHSLVIADDAFGRMDADGRAAMAPALDMLRSAVGASMNMTLSTEGLDQWFEAFRVLQAAQVRSSLLPWVNRAHPRLGEGVRKRLEQAAAITDEQVGDARAVRARAVA